jgi:putative component of toxin-antitoxin plasmid stabilization module
MKRITARFYRTEAGNEPVKEWLQNLHKDDRLIVGKDIAKAEFGWPIGMPTCDKVGKGIWEVRSTIKKGKVEARTYFCVDGGVMLLLHGREGKSGQDDAIQLARDRLASHRKRKDEDQDDD